MPLLQDAELRFELHRIVQEDDDTRLLDSIEIVAVRAYLSARGLQLVEGDAIPQTLHEWIEWAGHCSKSS